MSTEKPKLVPLPPQEPKTFEIPKELDAHVQSIRAFAVTHNLLSEGAFPSSKFKVVSDCMEFLKSLHGQAILVASQHPDASKVPELAQYLEKKEAQDGTPSQD